MDAVKAVSIIKQIGVGDLGYYDGCICAHFHVSGVSVDVSCRKSSGAKPEGFWGIMLRVYSRHMDCDPSGLRDVAVEVARQLRESESETPLMIRYCDYEQDKKQKCVYCGKPRPGYQDYLCGKCKTGKDAFGASIAESHDYSLIQPVGA